MQMPLGGSQLYDWAHVDWFTINTVVYISDWETFPPAVMITMRYGMNLSLCFHTAFTQRRRGVRFVSTGNGSSPSGHSARSAVGERGTGRGQSHYGHIGVQCEGSRESYDRQVVDVNSRIVERVHPNGRLPQSVQKVMKRNDVKHTAENAIQLSSHHLGTLSS